RVKRAVPMRLAGASRPGGLEPNSSSRISSMDKQFTPNMIAVEKGSRASVPRVDSVAPATVAAKPPRLLLGGLVALIVAGIGFAAVRGRVIAPAAVQSSPVTSVGLSGTASALAVAESVPSAPLIRSAEPAPSAVAAPAKVKFEFSSKPEKVQVFRDNQLLGTTPLALEFDRGRTSIKLVFNAWGYRSQEVTIVPETDRVMSIELTPAGAVRSTKNGGRLPGDLEPF
ncbi:MAG TPA: hypothetical protein PKA58_19355, partial [Polyangium sp.]|nr:hypothetical protein [Polyangium sp.]